ncbi:hypothetical protein HL41_04885 [Thermodesulfobacterium commune DSM 2178]|uniref:AP2/ERF domain-containing protein n=1 Tax=Thermodesulfobacterium commune DSM 2178 TaxID=289377 RepID=A0A075WUP7_9BACT|nr:hypothetical protein HL41_04885 [Thermodesulfobacterium commune DSM 2178]
MAIRPYKNKKDCWIVDISLGRKHRFRQIFHGTYEEAKVFEQELKKNFLSIYEKFQTSLIFQI